MYRDNDLIHRTLQGRNRARYGNNAIGIEIEIETAPAVGIFHGNPRLPQDWNTHEDASLAGGGVEFVLARPFIYDNLPAKVQALVDFCGDELPSDMAFQVSRRTSTHYHLNVEHKTAAEYMTQYLGFLVVEPMLVASQRHRDSNLFCLPTWLADSSIRDLTQRLRLGVGDAPFQGRAIGDWLRNEGSQNRRYRTINTVATSRGSLEFRCFESSLDPDFLLHWPKMLLDVVDRVGSMPVQSFRSMIGSGSIIDWSSEWAAQSDYMRPHIDKARGYWSADYQDALYQFSIAACSYLDKLKSTPETVTAPGDYTDAMVRHFNTLHPPPPPLRPLHALDEDDPEEWDGYDEPPEPDNEGFTLDTQRLMDEQTRRLEEEALRLAGIPNAAQVQSTASGFTTLSPRNWGVSIETENPWLAPEPSNPGSNR